MKEKSTTRDGGEQAGSLKCPATMAWKGYFDAHLCQQIEHFGINRGGYLRPNNQVVRRSSDSVFGNQAPVPRTHGGLFIFGPNPMQYPHDSASKGIEMESLRCKTAVH
jgi:hypothetical protein